ncbi:hypothetical protein [Vibrio cholerae]|uniref:hypothetical protein n=1 Tax=Vibrio cholerae TaxID=666 RepID=UPI000E0A8BCB|nr:hypothetical protein [Vibrio cholerae]
MTTLASFANPISVIQLSPTSGVFGSNQFVGDKEGFVQKAERQGMPFNIMDGQLAVYSPNGTKKSCGHEPCEYLPVMMTGDAIVVTSSLVH